ncbi:MAG: hypothetical protein NUV54_00805 [Candidatus Taylorbacteria bacterium]|nr:hypothetical protein [Candidatus Taylorbacteria bacterium]
MMSINKNDQFTRVYLFLWGMCLLVALLALIFYHLGFRLNNNLQPVKVGAIELISNQSEVHVFLDNRERFPEEKDGSYVLSSVSPGLHALLVSKDDFWPWAKTVMIYPDVTRSLSVFLFESDGLKTETVSADEKEKLYEQLGSARPFVVWPDESQPEKQIRSSDGNTALTVQFDTIYVEWVSESEPPPHYFCQENPCTFLMPVTVSVTPIKSVGFYKDRGDVILFSSGPSIYAIEVDHEDTQNFQPVYKGTDPYFYVAPDDTLYIQDGTSFLRASL